MKKSVIIVCLLAFAVLLEAIALIWKFRTSDSSNFAFDTQEFNLPTNDVKIPPFVFESDFVEQTDTALSAISEDLDNSFGIHLSHTFNRLTLQQQENAEIENERLQKFNEFRNTMLSQPINIRGTYLGDNQCEVDGVRGVCANGVYKLESHCIACFDGFCAGTVCAEENTKAEETIPQDATDSSLLAKPVPLIEEEADEVVATIDDDAIFSMPEEELSDIAGTESSEQRQDNPPETEPQIAANEAPEIIATSSQPEPVIIEEKEAPAIPNEPETASESDALIAVVIDDIGLSIPFTNQIANIKYPLTVSFLPYGASNKEQVIKLKNAGFEVMLHAPMMPRVPADLAPVTLSPKMSKAEIQEKLLKMMERFEGTGMHGINNHMGSAFTESREAMQAIMEVLRERNMYFLDSKTTSRSVGRAVSKEYGVPYVARDVFLDNERQYDYIMGQFRATERIAKRQGYAIAIGHPYQQTLQALRDWLKESEQRSIKIVPLSDLVAKLN